MTANVPENLCGVRFPPQSGLKVDTAMKATLKKEAVTVSKPTARPVSG